ncbi:deoxyribose-phosphate aldolase [Rhizoctonia solani AG-1 IB]|uniref:deoxyribose-phosphate aldolase n=1 Tax=Thanatephorus cucumeris (strain AG1-IB / isolate 7/3/14) TaxID=1108050 RepID=M5CGC8_THACB|nr:deoxyribose-phosphate aldolase [Rhizoctonia solani AG-1 IB]
MPTVKFDVTLKDLSKMIDVSLLHPTMTDSEIILGLQDARTYDAATACVKPYAVTMALEALEGTTVKVCPVIGFPAGNSTTAVKVYEATEVVKEGAQEVDMVINIGKALSGEWDYVSDEIKQINAAVTDGGAILKVIFETDYLQDSHIIRLCEICSSFGVAFVKTSTGYGFNKQSNGMYSYAGATNHNLKLMRKHVIAGRRVANEYLALGTLFSTGAIAWAASRGGSKKQPEPESLVDKAKSALGVGESDEEAFIKKFIADAEKEAKH